jgi:ABC-2 type transport system permease protein
MSLILTSARVETRRLVRSGLLIGLLAVFAFFGLSGPALALYMPEILGAAASTEQLTIEAATATPEDGIALFNQSAMQLGLILAVAVAITSLSWDARPGSSIFYRTRVRSLARLTVPRLAVGSAAVVASYAVALLLAAWLTTAFLGPLEAVPLLAVGVSSATYLVMCMSIGYLIMALTRRTAAAIAAATVLTLMLPLLNSVDALAPWVPTTLLAAGDLGTRELAAPWLAAVAVTVLCLVAAGFAAANQQVRRDA